MNSQSNLAKTFGDLAREDMRRDELVKLIESSKEQSSSELGTFNKSAANGLKMATENIGLNIFIIKHG